MNEPSVQLHNVVKFHGDVPGVDHLSLNIRSGEFFSLLGPSGSGKTTTLRLIAGLDQPNEGEIRIHGRLMNDHPPNRRPVNMVFQHYALFPHMNVFQNVAFGLQMQGHHRSLVKTRVRQTLKLVKLEGKDRRRPSQLSGGEQQRVTLAQALVNRPTVLLLDEPLGALDQQLRQEMQGELKRIQEQVKCTFVCVTHHQEEALLLSDRVAVMDQGQIRQVGTPQEIYDEPASLFVAKFVGLSNILNGHITDLRGQLCTVKHAKGWTIQVKRPSSVSRGDHVTVILRPESLSISGGLEDPAFENTLPAIIHKATYHGSEMLYQARLSDGSVWTVRRPLFGQHVSEHYPGQTVFLQWHAHQGIVLPT